MRRTFFILMVVMSLILVGCGESVEDKVLAVVRGDGLSGDGGVVYVEPAVDRGVDYSSRAQMTFRVVTGEEDWVVEYCVGDEAKGKWNDVLRYPARSGDEGHFAETAKELIFKFAGGHLKTSGRFE